MENIKFEITEQDVKQYLKSHKNDEAIKYKEAMFVKYMREHQEITKESLEILMQKYNWVTDRIDGLYFYDDYDRMRSIPFKTFDSYLDGINNLDISGICHILIPTFGYYDNVKAYSLIKTNSVGLNALLAKLLKGTDTQLKQAFDDYYIAGKVDYMVPDSRNLYSIKMGKEHCRRELEEYSHIYGEDNVKQIRKIIRERV